MQANDFYRQGYQDGAAGRGELLTEALVEAKREADADSYAMGWAAGREAHDAAALEVVGWAS